MYKHAWMEEIELYSKRFYKHINPTHIVWPRFLIILICYHIYTAYSAAVHVHLMYFSSKMTLASKDLHLMDVKCKSKLLGSDATWWTFLPDVAETCARGFVTFEETSLYNFNKGFPSIAQLYMCYIVN